MYLPDSEKPYTGEIFINYSSGENEYTGVYENGILISESYLNKDGTQKEPLNYQILVQRDSIFYLNNSNDIFTGPVFNIIDKKSEGYIKDGKRHGLFRFYHKNGQLEGEVTFKYGKKNGVSKYYDENGQLRAEQPWKDGKEDGLWKDYDENGQLESEIMRIDGMTYSNLNADNYSRELELPFSEYSLPSEDLLPEEATKIYIDVTGPEGK